MTEKLDEEKIKEIYQNWYATVQILIDNAEKGFMPLVAKSLQLSIEIAKIYEQGFLQSIKK